MLRRKPLAESHSQVDLRLSDRNNVHEEGPLGRKLPNPGAGCHALHCLRTILGRSQGHGVSARHPKTTSRNFATSSRPMPGSARQSHHKLAVLSLPNHNQSDPGVGGASNLLVDSQHPVFKIRTFSLNDRTSA